MNTYLQDVKKIFNLSLPMITSQITRLLNGFIATIFVAKLGTDDLAAMALGQSFWLVFFLFCMGLFFSTSILVGNHHAGQRKTDVEKTVAHSVVLGLIFSVPVMILLHLAKYLFLLCGQNPVVASLAQAYIDPLTWAIPAFFVSINLQQFLIGISRPKMLNLFSGVTLLINVILFNFLILGHDGFPRLGVAGAGYSITIGGWASLFLTVGYIRLNKTVKQYRIFSRIKEFSFKQLMLAFNVGWPIGLTMVLEMIAQMILVFFIGVVSTDALAAYQVVWQLSLIALMIPVACSQAIAVVTSQHIGANECSQIRRSTMITWGLCLLLVLMFSCIFWIAPHAAAGLFLSREHNPSAETFHIAVVMLMITGFMQLFDATRFILNGTLRGMRDVQMPMLISIAAFWVVGIPLAAIVIFVLKLGVIALWSSMIVPLLLLVFLLLKRLMRKTAGFI